MGLSFAEKAFFHQADKSLPKIRCKNVQYFIFVHGLIKTAVADLGEGPGGPASPPLILGKKKEEMTEGKMAYRASKSRPPPPPPLAQGLDPPLDCLVTFILLTSQVIQRAQPLRANIDVAGSVFCLFFPRTL